jgi:K+-sensing histidine kinase KdpD
VHRTANPSLGRWVLALGPLTAIVVAWATESVRDDMGVANVALVLALVCVAAALVHPRAGLVTSAVAALALNYFHTVPIHSLRMSQSDEITTVVLLIVHGLAVSIGATLRARTKVSTHRTNVSDAAVHDLRTLLAEGSSLVAAWQTAVVADTGHAASLDVMYLPTTGDRHVVIAGHQGGAFDPDRDVVLVPEAGAVLELHGGLGALLITPQPGLGAIETSRAHLQRFADQVAAALTA